MRIGRSRALQSAKYLERKRKKQILAYSLISMSVVSFVVIIIVLLRLPSMQISNIDVRGNTTLHADDLKAQVVDTLDGNYLFLIPKSNRLFYPKKSIKEVLLDSNKKINTLSLDANGLKSLMVIVTERLPSAVACEGFKGDDEANDECFFVDNTGYIYDTASQFSEGVYMKYYMSLDENPMKVGEKFMETERFVRFQDFISAIKNAEIITTGILIGKDGNHELYIRNADQSLAVIYFDDRIELEKISSNLIAFWQNSTSKNFDYVNLRFGNSIFFMKK